jgi:hypothetical protein
LNCKDKLRRSSGRQYVLLEEETENVHALKVLRQCPFILLVEIRRGEVGGCQSRVLTV